MFSCVFVSFPCGALGQLWYLIVSIPDRCLLPYFKIQVSNISVMSGLLKERERDREKERERGAERENERRMENCLFVFLLFYFNNNHSLQDLQPNKLDK